jgi:hypothetical protein
MKTNHYSTDITIPFLTACLYHRHAEMGEKLNTYLKMYKENIRRKNHFKNGKSLPSANGRLFRTQWGDEIVVTEIQTDQLRTLRDFYTFRG